MAAGEDAPFTEERARAVLAAAGVRAQGARLLSLGENAVFVLDGADAAEAEHHRGSVVRVGRSAGGTNGTAGAGTGPGPYPSPGASREAELVERARRELRVAAWLEREGVPAVRAARPEPVVADGHPITFWRRLPAPVREPDPTDLAGLLRRVHALARPPFPLPRRRLLSGVERWLRLAGNAIPAGDAAYLRARCDDLAAAVDALVPLLPPGPLHGDALPRNVHVGPAGPVLVDLETFSDDLREHDLVVMALSRDRYGLGEAAYGAFVAAYGWDVREWAGCSVLRGARETASCAWVAPHAPGSPAARREFARRVAALREGDATVRWFAF